MKLALALLCCSTMAAADPLRIDVKPATTTWKTNQHIPVELVVSNPAKTAQSMKVMLCSWEDHWKSSDAALTWEPWGCDKNYAADVTLAPGKSRTWKLEMFATAPGQHSLEMTFTPEGLAASKSKPVVITVTR
jgi:hypothetical protein